MSTGLFRESLVVVNCYDKFDLLPHQPKGVCSGSDTVQLLKLNHLTGELTKVSALEGLTNPAFMRYFVADDGTKMVYVCTETIKDQGTVVGLKLDSDQQKLEKVFEVSAEGYSTCYITITKDRKRALIVNYWDSVLGTYEIGHDGKWSNQIKRWAPEKKVVARNIDDHLTARQLEPHCHALVIDNVVGRIALVPDLGDDTVRQFVVGEDGSLEPIGIVQAGEGRGPRYVEFHPILPVCYVVNELSSTVTTYKFDIEAAKKAKKGDKAPIIEKLQELSTIPENFETGKGKNTCGRTMCTKDGKYVLTSNRGHDSISSMKVDLDTGLLSLVGIYKTRGRTPRHFQLSCDGSFVLAANQDSETIESFHLRPTGELEHTGFNLEIPSPNFVLSEAPLPVIPSRDA